MRNQPHARKLRRYWDLPLRDKWLLLRAVCWLALARLWVAMVPFPRLVDRLSIGPATQREDTRVAQRVSLAVKVAAASVPWRSDCFPQAIAAYKLLKRYSLESTIHLGVDRLGREDLLAHAWVTSGDMVVIGDRNLDRYAEIHRLGA